MDRTSDQSSDGRREPAPGARQRPRRGAGRALGVALLCVAAARVVPAQQRPPRVGASARPAIVGGRDDVRRRDGVLLGESAPDGTLLRAPSEAGSLPAPGTDGIRALAPEGRVVWNGTLPFSMNDGALWAGRGWSALVRGGVDARRGRVRVLLMPEFVVAENRVFDVAANRRPGRGELGWPWSSGRFDIDLPSRFGTTAWRLLSPGQSAITVDAGPVTVGVATENEWWGPGVRNALVMSNNAEGFPHALVRTREPIRTRLGTIEARWQTGVLTPSLFSDTAVDRRWRAISGVAATIRPAGAPGLTVGIARTVVSDVPRPAGVASRAADALVRWSPTPRDSLRRPRADQLSSLFVRWLVPAARAEAYVELGRQGAPRSWREIVVAPHDGGALTLGLQALPALRGGRAGHVRVQLEATTVEQSQVLGDRPPPPPFYTGLATRDGYTHRGQLLGAAIGPGGSSQWASADWVRAGAEVGLFAGRIRWSNDLLYAQENANFFRHDVSTFLGARALARLPRAHVSAEAYWSRRYNYLFQNGIANPGGRGTVDLTNVTFGLAVTPR